MSAAGLEFTGERFLPECRGEIWLEHWHRYHFAAALAAGRRVLDVASGEGYGSALLARTAGEVVGVDAAADAIAHARAAYGDQPNLRFVTADCTRLPFPDAAFDLVVSFETIEHITGQREFLGEVRRVLAPGGVLLLSSPNKAEYSDRRAYANPFHVSELYRDELRDLLAAHFPHLAWYGQRMGFCSTIAVEGAATGAGGELVDPSAPGIPPPESPAEPLYFLVGCAQSATDLAALDGTFSVLGDPADTVYRDYQETYRKFVAASEAVTAFRERESRHEQAAAEFREREAQHERALAAAASAAQISLDAAQAGLDVTLARLEAVETQRDAAQAAVADWSARYGALDAAHAALAAAHGTLEAGHAALRAEAAARTEEIARLQEQIADLRGLTATLGATLHAAQQSALRLTGALHETNARYQSALDAAHRVNAEQASAASAALQATLERHREELAGRDAQAGALQDEVARQKAELAGLRTEVGRRAGWRWRLRSPWHAG